MAVIVIRPAVCLGKILISCLEIDKYFSSGSISVICKQLIKICEGHRAGTSGNAQISFSDLAIFFYLFLSFPVFLSSFWSFFVFICLLELVKHGCLVHTDKSELTYARMNLLLEAKLLILSRYKCISMVVCKLVDVV